MNTFNPEKYAMAVCPSCKGNGYILTPKRKPCPKCGGFGFVKKEPEKDVNTSQTGKE
jgi:DnaJ-class molecular chaperone